MKGERGDVGERREVSAARIPSGRGETGRLYNRHSQTARGSGGGLQERDRRAAADNASRGKLSFQR